MEIILLKEDMGFTAKSVKSLLSKLGPFLKQSNEQFEVKFDFKVEDSDELSTTIIWRTLRDASRRNLKLKVKYLNSTKKYFDERHFFESLTGKRSFLMSSTIPINFDTFTPIRPSKLKPQNEAIENILTDVTKNFLRKDNEFHEEIKVHMIESIANAFDHSQSEESKQTGIICSLKENTMLDFCVADMGQGIKNSFLSNPVLKGRYDKLNDWEVISDATNKNISCNPTMARHPGYTYSNGGIGLYYLKQFIKYHSNCRFVVISGTGYYYIDTGRKIAKTANLVTRWPGTIIYFRININQGKSSGYKNLIQTEFLDEFDNKQVSIV